MPPGSTHDARLLRCPKAFQEITPVTAIPDKAINLGEGIGDIPLVTIGDIPLVTIGDIPLVTIGDIPLVTI